MPVLACMFDFVEADCVVDGVKPTVSVNSIGLLAPMGRMNAEHCGLEWGRQCARVLYVSEFSKSLLINSRLYTKMKV